jgi:hypothetical protein
VKTIELKTHHRIGHEICRAADAVGKAAGISPILDNCNYKGPESKVQFFNCASDDEQIKRIIEALTVQLTAYPEELLAVVGARKQDLDYLRGQLEASKLAPLILPHRSSGSDDPRIPHNSPCSHAAHSSVTRESKEDRLHSNNEGEDNGISVFQRKDPWLFRASTGGGRATQAKTST